MEAERPNCKMAQPANRRCQHFRPLKLATDGDAPEERNRCTEEIPSSPKSSCSSTQSSLFCSDASMCADVEETKKMLSACISHGWVSVIGRRREMEDTVAVEPGFFGVGEYDFYGVYDGHGGVRVAEACREKMHVVIAEEAEAAIKGQRKGEEVGWTRALTASFERLDGEVARKDCAEAVEKSVGSTAVVAIVGRRQIVVANCGDSRAVLSRGRVAVALSDDHKPNRPDELERVEAAGGRIINWDGYRVLGVLATSRSIGDYYLKPYVTSEPEITVTQRSDKDEFLILATDGLWDVVSNESACRIARQCLSGHAAKMFPTAVCGRSAAEAAALLARHAIARGSKDNISVVVVELMRLDERKRRSNVKA